MMIKALKAISSISVVTVDQLSYAFLNKCVFRDRKNSELLDADLSQKSRPFQTNGAAFSKLLPP